MVAIRVTGLNKTFDQGKKALNAVDFKVDEGEMVALIGASGSGKSTLIRHISGLMKSDLDAGAVEVLEQPIQVGGKLAKGVRKTRSEIGVVFQQFNLVNRLSVLTNVLIGLLGQIPTWRGTLGLFTRDEKKRALQALSRVGIANLCKQRSSTLSGGQQQRAAIARAITQGAKVILADEPISSLDPASARKVMDTLENINREDGVTVLVSLHQVDYALKYCPRTIAMRNGEIVFDGASARLTPEFLEQLYGDASLELLGDTSQEEPVVTSLPEQAVA